MKKGFKLIMLVLVAAVFLNSTASSVFDLKKPDTASAEADTYNFKYTGIVPVGNEVMPLVGQLSKDGKSMYLTSQNAKGQKNLYKMSRARVGDNFDAPVKLTGTINEGKYDIIMPTVSADEKTMVFVNSLNGMQNGNDLYISTKDETGAFTAVRALDEINDPNLSDSYPWLSANGLRIYFTKQKGSSITFYVADRATTADKFSNVKELGLTLPKVSNNMSCFLTANELEVYALSGDNIYHASRKTTKTGFDKVDEIANTANSGYLSGITMTDDAKELFVYNSVGFRNTQILRFVNTESDMTTPVISTPGK